MFKTSKHALKLKQKTPILSTIMVCAFLIIGTSHLAKASTVDTVSGLEEKWRVERTSYYVDWHPSMKILAFATHNGEIEIRKGTDGTLLSGIKVRDDSRHPDIGPSSLRYSPNGSWIAVWGYGIGDNGSDRKVVKVFNTEGFSIAFEMDFEFKVSSFDWSPDGSHFSVGTSWDTLAGNRTGNWTYIVSTDPLRVADKYENPATIRSLKWSPDGSYLVGLSRSGLQKWSATSTRYLTHEVPEDRKLCCLQWVTKSNQALFSEGSTIMTLDPEEMVLTDFLFVGDTISFFVVSPDNLVIAIKADSSDLRFYEIDSLRKMEKSIRISTPTHLAWSGDGSSLAVAAFGTQMVLSVSSESYWLPILMSIAATLVVGAIAYSVYVKMRRSRKN